MPLRHVNGSQRNAPTKQTARYLAKTGDRTIAVCNLYGILEKNLKKTVA
jgi:hypothetical protein